MAGLAQMFYNQYGRAPSFSELSTLNNGGNLSVTNVGSDLVNENGTRKGDLSNFATMFNDPFYSNYQNSPVSGSFTNKNTLSQQQPPQPVMSTPTPPTAFTGGSNSFNERVPYSSFGGLSSLYSVNRDPWGMNSSTPNTTQGTNYGSPDFWNNVFKEMGWVK